MARPSQLTSDRKVWADFWAPMCSRYSYTYSASLRGGGRRSGSQEAWGAVSLEPLLKDPWRGVSGQAPAFSWAGGDEGQGAHSEP